MAPILGLRFSALSTVSDDKRTRDRIFKPSRKNKRRKKKKIPVRNLELRSGSAVMVLFGGRGPEWLPNCDTLLAVNPSFFAF